MRTFQFSDAKSHKFWNIDVQGTGFTVTYGKVGAKGQTQTKTFADAAAAQAEADKLIREKLKKGYTETTPKASSSPADAFEAALRANPDDFAGWCAFADYLVEQGDPRGEFMQVQLALEDESRPKEERDRLKAREAELLKEHEREWLGPLAAFTLDAEPVTYWNAGREDNRAPVGHTFRRGWLARVEFHDLTVNQARALSAAPEARLVREVIVSRVEREAVAGSTEPYIDSHYQPGPDVPADADPWQGPALHSLCRCPLLGALRVFQLGEGAAGLDGLPEADDNCHMPGELAYHLVKQMPNLEELYLYAHRVDANKLFVLPMPNLRALLLYHSNSYPLDKLAANASLVRLTALLCHPHAMEYDDEENGAYIRLEHLKAVCRAPQFQKLTNLRLRLTDFGDKGAEEIVASGVLKRLKVLDLQGGCTTADGVKVLTASPDFKNLEYLNLNSNAVHGDGIAALQASGVRFSLDSQHDSTPGEFGEDGEIPEYLFEGDIE